MADTAQAAIAAIVRIREAEREAARAQVFAADAALARVEAAENHSLADRDQAEAGWRGFLQARLPDPAQVQLAGDWLVERERGWHAARLDTGIARAQLDAVRQDHGASHARLDAARDIGGRLRKAAACRREAADLAEAADAFLRRRGS